MGASARRALASHPAVRPLNGSIGQASVSEPSGRATIKSRGKPLRCQLEVLELETRRHRATHQAEITLAEKIGENESYQRYLISLEQVKVMGEVGKEQAKALEKADVKIIANAGGTISNGISKVTDLFSANGGIQVGSMLEALGQTELGKSVLNKVTGVEGSTAKDQ